MKLELIDCEPFILREIANSQMYRNDVAQTYALCLRSSEEIDWFKVNQAIIDRWSPYALKWIKERAWNGRCFEREIS